MSDFAGMLFTLKKREQHIAEDDTELYKYVIMGYYDGLDIHTVKKWYNLRPRGLQERRLQVDLKEPFIDQYTFRALAPGNRDDLEKKGFNYRFWISAGQKNVGTYNNFQNRVRQRYPFVCMAVINLTEKFVKERKSLQEMQDWLTDKVRECSEMDDYGFRELHCAVFPSIGYSDFILLFLTDSLDKVAGVICRLRGSADCDGSAVISNCYSVCGLDKELFQGKGTALSGDIRVTIRINLKQGISPQEFLGCMEKELSAAVPPFSENLKDYFYVTFGNADCFLLPGKSIDQYLRLHCKGGILNPGNSFFQNYISDVRTSVWLRGLEESPDGVECRKREEIDLKKFTIPFQMFMGEYDRFLKKNNGHMRSSRAMQQTMKNFLNIAYAPHGFDVSAVVGDAILCALDNVQDYIRMQPFRGKYCYYKGERHNSEEYNKRLYIAQCNAVKSLDEFREYIGAFISDLIRSDRPFIEGNVLTHSSIGSATKLLFAYSAILGRLTERYGMQGSFVFVVLSGGCDRTRALDFFENVRDKVEKPIVIQIPEMSLYDIQGTLFRILHEYMHYIGDRKRKSRYKYLVHAVAGALAWEICELVYNGGENDGLDFYGIRWKRVSQRALNHLSGKLRSEVEKELVELWQKSRTETETKIFNAILNGSDFQNYGKDGDEELFFSQELINGIFSQKSLAKIFGKMIEEDTGRLRDGIQKAVYDILYTSDKEMVRGVQFILKNQAEKWNGNPEEKQLELPLRAFWFAGQNYKFRDANNEDYDSKIQNFMEQYFNSFLELPQVFDANQEKFSVRFGCTKLIEHILSSMTEAFSDCAAVSTIEMRVEDFLLAFIYELWDIESAFPPDLGNVLRLGADLQVLYGISGGLPQEVKRAVWNKAQLRKKQGYEYRNVKSMIRRMEEILRAYQLPELAHVRGALEAYLQECFNKKEDWQSKELVRLYKVSELDTMEKIYDAANELICLWKDLKSGRADYESN